MWPIIWGTLRGYGPYVTFPFACVIGLVGYYVEGKVSSRYTPWRRSTQDERLDRKLHEVDCLDPTVVQSLKEKTFPSSVFLLNRSPALEENDNASPRDLLDNGYVVSSVPISSMVYGWHDSEV
ncbi:unnamed protein product [Cyprideis torosa]|uniref:Uncharacterized protein n=1 Tax=Cyprideis torosa TaxID=163714 RepID=A0A7R8W9U2_9CRUS|nr:unnamed protein product [Cyprideis torosa]CAG0885220.1 unnamed protein product [Cyprideis torosa]